MKVGCSTKAEKVVREQLPFREVKIASCTEQSFTAINDNVSVLTVLRGTDWPATDWLSKQNCI